MANRFGDEHAEIYDELLGDLPDVGEIVERVGRPGTTVLEMGSGTGRLAIPLAAAGADVTALEVSEKMLAVFARKPGADRVRFVRGDFTSPDLKLDGVFDTILLSRNTLVGMPDPDDQLATLETARRHLAPQGRLYVDLGVPKPDGDRSVSYAGMLGNRVVLHQRIHDPFTQRIAFRRIILGGSEDPLVLENPSRWIWPAELTLMVRLAGLTPVEQWEDFTGKPFTRTSLTFVTVCALA